MQWRNLYRGFFMGISDLIPGVSGGTIAFILGIYDELLAAISGFFSRNWKKHIGFLLPLRHWYWCNTFTIQQSN